MAWAWAMMLTHYVSLEFIILKCIEKRSLEPFLILHLVMLFSFFSPFSSSLCARAHSLVPFSLFGQTYSQYNLIRTFSLNKHLLLREITEKDFFFDRLLRTNDFNFSILFFSFLRLWSHDISPNIRKCCVRLDQSAQTMKDESSSYTHFTITFISLLFSLLKTLWLLLLWNGWCKRKY